MICSDLLSLYFNSKLTLHKFLLKKLFYKPDIRLIFILNK